MSRAGRQGDFREAVVQSRRGTSICLLVSLLDRAEQHTLRTKDEMWVGHRSILLQMKELRPARQRFAHGQRASKGQCWALTARLRDRPHVCSQSWIVTAAHQSQEKREVRGGEDAEVSAIFRFYPKGDGRN